MKKSILNIGTVLDKTEQKQINGGNPFTCNTAKNCMDDPDYMGGPVACVSGFCVFLLNEF